MGITNSKAERSDALRLCKERKKFLKQAIDSRCALAAAHISYIQSLRNIGIALRKYAETEVLLEPSLSISVIDPDNTPLHLTYPSPSPSRVGNVSDTPVLNGSPLSQPMARVSYMRSGGGSALTVRVRPPPRNMHVEEGEFSMPPPPPPCPDSGSSWDFFDPADEFESFRFGGQSDLSLNLDHVRMHGDFGEKNVDFDETSGIPKSETPSNGQGILVVNNASSAAPAPAPENTKNGELKLNESAGNGARKASLEQSNLKRNKPLLEKDICAATENPSEFVTHRAKDFLSSIKDIDNQFFRASESGKEVSRMLESNNIRVGYAESRGKLPASVYLTSFGAVCCQGRNVNVSDVSDQNVTKVITWRRTTSSRNPMATTKDDNDDRGSDFIEEFCMISGSHSSTLDRMYAWERKLYDEVKASEFIRKEYDLKCDKLRHLFAKDLSPQVIDKTRAVVKDLHSRIRVALHAVNSISKRIENMRDEELLPQVLELIHGLTRMWKFMLECHHSQYVTISLAYHAKSFTGAPRGETQKQIMNQLQDEVEYFHLSFTDWINGYTSYVETLNSWLQNCILQPRERYKGRRAFSPRRVLLPPIIVLCRDWSAGIKSLPTEEVSIAIRAFLFDLQRPARHNYMHKNEESESKDDGKNDDPSNLSFIQTSLTNVLDRLTKFSEASVKMCEDIHQKCEAARNAYDNYKAPPRSFSI
ncbi:hypothetical protein Fot_20819 [Forsythia ovata]|uniref:BZIP transcription factor n=3 Tax=Forsythia ovata TaxID=205694 RepID=A0ABD1UU63_9LAMI